MSITILIKFYKKIIIIQFICYNMFIVEINPYQTQSDVVLYNGEEYSSLTYCEDFSNSQNQLVLKIIPVDGGIEQIKTLDRTNAKHSSAYTTTNGTYSIDAINDFSAEFNPNNKSTVNQKIISVHGLSNIEEALITILNKSSEDSYLPCNIEKLEEYYQKVGYNPDNLDFVLALFELQKNRLNINSPIQIQYKPNSLDRLIIPGSTTNYASMFNRLVDFSKVSQKNNFIRFGSKSLDDLIESLLPDQSIDDEPAEHYLGFNDFQSGVSSDYVIDLAKIEELIKKQSQPVKDNLSHYHESYLIKSKLWNELNSIIKKIIKEQFQMTQFVIQ